MYCLTDSSKSACKLGSITAQVQKLGLEPGLTLKPLCIPLQLSAAVLSSQKAEGTVGDERWRLQNKIPRLIFKAHITKEGKAALGM